MSLAPLLFRYAAVCSLLMLNLDSFGFDTVCNLGVENGTDYQFTPSCSAMLSFTLI
jgi:hypothetical protein